MPTIESILRADERLAPIVAEAKRFRLQVVLGRVEANADGRPRLVQDGFRLEAEYFYPASSIKLLAAVAAFEALPELAAETGLEIDESTALTFHPLFDGEVLAAEDPSNLAGGKITVGHEMRKLFLVSDNEAFNRLYEWVGPDQLNRSMLRAGLSSTRIVHRLSEARTPAENRMTPRIGFRGQGFEHEIPARTVELDLPAMGVGGLSIGRGYLRAGKRVEEPFDFSQKNRMSLADLQRALARVVRPDVDSGGADFRLSDAHREQLIEAMGQYPRESANPRYRVTEYPDHWGKFLLPGLEKVLPKARLRIYNKIGQAYGFSVENAYVTDRATGRGFFLAAVIYTNRDGILNDDRYEYDEVAAPFFAALGEAVARSLWE
ncbi:MAG: serine hydrolase [Acidobacteriota bacterium]